MTTDTTELVVNILCSDGKGYSLPFQLISFKYLP